LRLLQAASLAMATHWACNLAVGAVFLALVQQHSVGFVYRAFAAVAAAAAVFVVVAVPETARK
jgi:drug/metabolite transporter superfamily protein YnfA